MKLKYKPSIAWLISIAENDDQEGFCLACGAEGQAAEPDASGYACDECGENAVYGAEELLISGIFTYEKEAHE